MHRRPNAGPICETGSGERAHEPRGGTAALDAAALLSLWERGIGQPPWRRDEVLLSAAGEAAVPVRLGARNARLMALHGSLFGNRIDLVSACPHCGAAIEFGGASDAIAADLLALPAPTGTHVVDLDGHHVEFRVPDSEAIAGAAQADEGAPFELALLRRCVLASTRDTVAVPVETLPGHVLDAVSARMEALDPAATVSFDLECPDCATRWAAPLDVGQLIWRRVQAAAERLLLDVDTLARAYGWTEREVLALSPTRRAAYLQLATS